jgi:hypothetical protein
MKKNSRIPIIFALTALIAGCAEPVMKPVSNTDESPVRVSIAVGDTVRVLTKYGDRPTFKVTEITDKSLIGKGQNILYEDMAFVEKRVSGSAAGDVTAVTLGFAAGAVLILGITQAGAGFPSGT